MSIRALIPPNIKNTDHGHFHGHYIKQILKKYTGKCLYLKKTVKTKRCQVAKRVIVKILIPAISARRKTVDYDKKRINNVQIYKRTNVANQQVIKNRRRANYLKWRNTEIYHCECSEQFSLNFRHFLSQV